MIDCATLLAAFLAGVHLEHIDRTRVYDVPAALVENLTIAQKTIARGCALKHGIRYRIVKNTAGGQGNAVQRN
jgi:hypothetical protein